MTVPPYATEPIGHTYEHRGGDPDTTDRAGREVISHISPTAHVSGRCCGGSCLGAGGARLRGRRRLFGGCVGCGEGFGGGGSDRGPAAAGGWVISAAAGNG